GVPTPMQRVTLTASPRTARPDHIIARDFFRDLSHCLVVTQRIKIVLVPATHPRGILTCERRALTEVHLDRTNAKLQQISQLALIPLDRFRVTHVERRVLERKPSAFVPDVITLLDHLFPKLILAGEVGVLPEAHVKSLLLQIRHHLCRIAETRARKTIVAAPVGFEPAGIEVNHIGGNAVRSQLLGHEAHLVFGVVSDTAHPKAKGPEWRHWTATSQRGVFRENVFRLAKEYKQIEV